MIYRRNKIANPHLDDVSLESENQQNFLGLVGQNRLKRIKKVLVANRGEIALRVQRACRKLNVPAVLVASEADQDIFYARAADELVHIGPSISSQSYLNISRLIDVAKEYGCNAIHPGYGFLSENPDFAKAVEEAGLIFVGPTSTAIEALGSKTRARDVARSVGVSVTDGSGGGLNDEQLIKSAKKIRFPLLIKAVGGGGGRGMRVAKSIEDLKELLPIARSEGKKFFGSDDVYLEKFIEKPRHVEVQILADSFGNVLHLGTRDCSTQRRNQKLIEEAPAPGLSDKLRDRLHKAAVNIAKKVKYTGVGTAEFLISGDRFYFLEMNTRIQVEHTVTEQITGVDLVEQQLLVADGQRLKLRQSKLRFVGHSLEFRICAEDVLNGFTPSLGKITVFDVPEGPGIRLETGYSKGDEVGAFYDSMIAKLIVTASSRAEAIVNAEYILNRVKITGVKTNVDFHKLMLRLTSFKDAPVNIQYLSEGIDEELIERVERAYESSISSTGLPKGAFKQEKVFYRSSHNNEIYELGLITCGDGNFIAALLKRDRVDLDFAVRSNSPQAALRGLCNLTSFSRC